MPLNLEVRHLVSVNPHCDNCDSAMMCIEADGITELFEILLRSGNVLLIEGEFTVLCDDCLAERGKQK